MIKEAEKYAYMDIKTSSKDMQKKILSSRKNIIYTKSWVADDLKAYTIDVKTHKIISEIPKFHDVFPADWDLPIADSEESAYTFNAPLQAAGNGFSWEQTYLSHPTSALSPVFERFTGTGENYYTVPCSIPGSSYNLGYTNLNTGADVLSKTYLDSATGVILSSTTDGVSYGIRASTYSTPGYAYFSGDYLL